MQKTYFSSAAFGLAQYPAKKNSSFFRVTHKNHFSLSGIFQNIQQSPKIEETLGIPLYYRIRYAGNFSLVFQLQIQSPKVCQFRSKIYIFNHLKTKIGNVLGTQLKVGSKPVEAFLGIKYGVYEPFHKPKLYEYSAGSEIGKLNDNLKIWK